MSVGSRMMRPAASQAASPEPTAIETEKMARQAVTTSSVPPNTFFTSGGNSESETAPTSQNQLVTMAPHQIRRSSRRCLSRSVVETKILRRIARSGAASPVRGMNRLAAQHISENTIISSAKYAGSPPSLAASPPTMVPSRMAMKVAPSTSALPAGSSERARWSGRMPYLIGPNSDPITPNRSSATNSTNTECIQKPNTAMKAMPISANLRRCATRALLNRSATSPPSAERKKLGAMKTASAKVMSASASAPPIWNRIRKTSAFLRKLSLNAAKNWVQNRGAKRRVINRDEDMALPPVPNGPRDPEGAANASSVSLPSSRERTSGTRPAERLRVLAA